MLFTAVFTILTTTVLLILHVSSVVYSMAIRWDRLVSILYFLPTFLFYSIVLLLHSVVYCLSSKFYNAMDL